MVQKSITITGNGDFAKFTDIKVDGIIVDKNSYEAKSGSTIITLKTTYLNTLSEGQHTFEIIWSDGAVDTVFTIKKENMDNDILEEDKKPSDGENDNTSEEDKKPSDGENDNILEEDKKPSDGENDNTLEEDKKPTDGENDNISEEDKKPTDGENDNISEDDKEAVSSDEMLADTSPKTGEESSVILLVVLLFISAVGTIFLNLKIKTK